MVDATKRGLIIPMADVEVQGGGYIIHQGVYPQDLRAYLLFWDELVFPNSNIIPSKLGLDEQFLAGEGILRRTDVVFDPSRTERQDPVSILRDCHLQTFRELDAQEPGKWSLAPGDATNPFTGEDAIKGRGALVGLHNAVLIPDEEVPIADILEFKHRRRPELLALRVHLERVFQAIRKSEDGPLAWNTELTALALAISNHTRVSKENKFALRLTDLQASLNILPIAVAAIGAYTLGLPMVPQILASLLPALQVGPTFGIKFDRAEATPFQYVTSYHNDVIGR